MVDLTSVALFAIAAATPPSPRAWAPPSVVERASEALREGGIDLRSGDLQLEETEGAWTLRVRTSLAQTRERRGLELPPGEDEAAARVTSAAASLMGAFRLDDRDLGVELLRPRGDDLLGRVALESTFGLVGGTLGSVVGGLAGLSLGFIIQLSTRPTGDATGLYSVSIVSLASLGGAVGFGTGVCLAGEVTGGRGDCGSAVLGATLGAAAAAPLWASVGGLMAASRETGPTLVTSIVLTPVLALASSIFLYESTAKHEAVVRPVVTSDGSRHDVALVGRF